MIISNIIIWPEVIPKIPILEPFKILEQKPFFNDLSEPK